MKLITALCEKCQNCEQDYRLIGHEYREIPVCVYDLSAFPKAQKCAQYEPDTVWSEV